jgi:hypothetical protein
VNITIPDHIREAARRARANVPIEIVELALLRYEAGWSRGRIAEEAFCHVTTVDVWRRKAGMAPRGSGSPAEPRAPQEYINGVIESYQRTRCLARTAQEFDRNESTVRSLIKRHAPDLLQPVGGPTIPAPPGWETVQDYSFRHQRTKTGVYDALRAGRIPGARRFPQPRSRLGERWLIPEGTPDMLRPARGLRASPPRDELAARRPKAIEQPKEWLPREPFVAWVTSTGRGADDLADGNEPVARAIRRIVSGEQHTVELGWADALLLTHDVRIEDLWGDIDAALADGRETRFENVHRFDNARRHQETLDRIRAEMAAEDRRAA